MISRTSIVYLRNSSPIAIGQDELTSTTSNSLQLSPSKRRFFLFCEGVSKSSMRRNFSSNFYLALIPPYTSRSSNSISTDDDSLGS